MSGDAPISFASFLPLSGHTRGTWPFTLDVQSVAVKTVDMTRLRKAADRALIEQEVEIHASLDHANIVHFLTSKRTPDRRYVVIFMEFCPLDLDRFVRDLQVTVTARLCGCVRVCLRLCRDGFGNNEWRDPGLRTAVWPLWIIEEPTHAHILSVYSFPFLFFFFLFLFLSFQR